MPAWQTPSTFTVGEDITASLLNQFVTNNNSFLFQSLLVDEYWNGASGNTTGVGSGFTGLRVKCGTVSGLSPSSGVYSWTWAAAFPSACIGGLAEVFGGGGSGAQAQIQILTATTTGMSLKAWAVGTSTPATGTGEFCFVAVGY